MRFYVGAYGPELEGAAEGIGVLDAGGDSPFASGALTARPDAATVSGSPSWLAWHPTGEVVYAAMEGADTVRAFRRGDGDTLRPLGDPVRVGSAPCHIAVAPGGGTLVASCAGDGRLARIPLIGGRLGTPSIAPAPPDPFAAGASAATDPPSDLADAARVLRDVVSDEYRDLIPWADSPDTPEGSESPQTEEDAETERSPLAHEARFLPMGLGTIDMHFDLWRFWDVHPEGFRQRQHVIFPKGSGPRHSIWHPSGHLYVVTELSGEVFVLRPDVAGTWSIVSGVSLGGLASDQAAEIALSRDGEFVYAGLRGSNTLATLRVRANGRTLEPVALVEAGVDWPRHHLIERDTLLVAGQYSDDVVSLPIDTRTGVPGRPRYRAATPAPTQLLAIR